MSTVPKPFVFVLMPFSREFDDVYRLGIKPGCEAAGAYAERVDEQIFQERVLERLYNQIAKADIVVSDMTGRNPNVFYETGYAHALGKPVVLLTQTVDDIPFDLKDFPHVVYGGRIIDLLPQLEKRVRFLIDNPAKASQSTTNTIEVQVNDVRIHDHPSVRVDVSAGASTLSLSIDVHNSATRELRVVRCQIGLVSPSRFRRASATDTAIHSVVLDPETVLHYLPTAIDLLPGAWQKLTISAAVSEGTVPIGSQIAFMVRVFTESGHFDHPLTVETVRRDRRGVTSAQ